MKRLIHFIVFIASSTLLNAQNGTQPDSSRIISESQVTRTIDVLANDDLVAGKDYEITGYISTNTNIEINIIDNKTKITYKDNQTTTIPDTFQYIVRDKNTNTFDTNYVVVRKSDLPYDINPGDANQDDICNHIDLLAMGTAYGKTSIEREGLFLTSDWTPVKAYNWTNSNNVANHKHADADGSGVVDKNDISVLDKNYNKTSTNPSVKYSPLGGETISVSTDDSYTLSSGKDVLKIKVNLGDNINLIQKAYGIAFTLKLNSSNLTKDDFLFKHSDWFNDATNTIQYFKYNSTDNELDIAMTKTNGNGGNSGGEMGIVDVVIDDILGGLANSDTFEIEISKAVLIDSHYNLLPVTIPASKKYVVVNKSTTAVSNIDKLNEFNAYVVDREINIKLNEKSNSSISVYNILGNEVHTVTKPTKEVKIDARHWAAGIYFIKYDTITKKINLR